MALVCRSDRVAVLNIRTRTVNHIRIPGVTRVSIILFSFCILHFAILSMLRRCLCGVCV